ncbi:hypothetical protein AAC387_Pa11g0725 [Persea americana]
MEEMETDDRQGEDEGVVGLWRSRCEMLLFGHRMVAKINGARDGIWEFYGWAGWIGKFGAGLGIWVDGLLQWWVLEVV